MDNFNAQHPTRVRVWIRLALIGLFAAAASMAASLVNRPVQAQTAPAFNSRAAPPAHPETTVHLSQGRSGVFGVLNFEASDLNAYINTFFDVDGSYNYLLSCPVLEARPKWNGVAIGSPVARVHGGEKAIWFGDPSTGDYGGTGGDQQVNQPCVNPTHTGTLTTIPVNVPIDDLAYLSFWSWEQTEMSAPEHLFQCATPTHCQYDIRSVYISSTDQPFWQPKWNTKDNIYPTTLPEGDWHELLIDIKEYIGQEIQIRFAFDTFDGRYNEYQGWYIDDITLFTLEINNSIYLPLVRR